MPPNGNSKDIHIIWIQSGRDEKEDIADDKPIATLIPIRCYLKNSEQEMLLKVHLNTFQGMFFHHT